MSRIRIWLVAAVAAAATGAIAQSQEAPSPGAPSAGTPPPDAAKPYTVECGPDPEEERPYLCLVDRGTYVGWRTFHSICHTCHAQDAVGSTFAPDLLQRMQQIDKAEFMDAMNNGFEGQVGVMPAWKQDPNVNRYFEELWSYLLARADGVLLPGRPRRLPDPE